MVKFTWVSGGNGITPLKTPRPLLGPIDFANEKSFLVLCVVILAIAGLLVIWVRGGTTGRFLDALRGQRGRGGVDRDQPDPVAHHRLRALGRARRTRRRPAHDA